MKSYLIIIWLAKKHNEINVFIFMIYLFIINAIVIWSYFHCNLCVCNNLFMCTFTYWIALLTKPMFSANLKPSTFKVSQKIQTNFRSINKILIISIFMKLSHVRVYELCHSRLDIGLLVLTSSPQLSKFHKMSNGGPMNSNVISFIFIYFSIVLEFSQLHSSWAPSRHVTPFVTPYYVAKHAS
jgi:hypothetical protein